LGDRRRRRPPVAVLAALTLLDPQQHALGIDITGLERDDLGNAQSGTVGGGERRLEQQCDLLGAQHGRQPARFTHDREPPGKVRPVERHGEEETQRRDRTVDARRPPRSPDAARFASDSPLEGSGFEPSVPRDTTKVSEPAQVASAGFRTNRSTARTRADTARTPGAFRRTDGSNSCSLQQRVRCELEVS
jgi:hypothetical protein